MGCGASTAAAGGNRRGGSAFAASAGAVAGPLSQAGHLDDSVQLLLDEQGIVRSISSAAEAAYGLPASQYAGQHLVRMVHPQDAAVVGERLASALRQPTEPVALAFRRLTSSGYTSVRFVGWVCTRHDQVTGILGRETPAVAVAASSGAAGTGAAAVAAADDAIASSRSGVVLAGVTPRIAAGGVSAAAVTIPTAARAVPTGDRVLHDKVLHNAVNELSTTLKALSVSSAALLEAASTASSLSAGSNAPGGTGAAIADDALDVAKAAFASNVLAADVLTISRLQSGTFTPAPEVMPIRSTLKALAAQARGFAKAALRVSVAPLLPSLLILDGASLCQLVSNALLMALRHASMVGDSVDIVAYRADEPVPLPSVGAADDADGRDDGMLPVRRGASYRAARAVPVPTSQPGMAGAGASASVGQGELVVEIICCHGTGASASKDAALAGVDAAQQQPRGTRARSAGVFLPVARALTASMDGGVTMDERIIQTMLPTQGGTFPIVGQSPAAAVADGGSRPVIPGASGRMNVVDTSVGTAADARLVPGMGLGTNAVPLPALPGTAPHHWQPGQHSMSTTALLRIRLRLKFTEPSDAEARKAREMAVAAAAGGVGIAPATGLMLDGGNVSPRFEVLEAQDINAGAPISFPAAMLTGCTAFQGPRRGLPGPGWASVRLPDGSWVVGPMGAIEGTAATGLAAPITPAPGLRPPPSASAGGSHVSIADASGFTDVASMAPVPYLQPRTVVPPPAVPQLPLPTATGTGSDEEDIVISSTGAPLTPLAAAGSLVISARRPGTSAATTHSAAATLPAPLASSTAASGRAAAAGAAGGRPAAPTSRAGVTVVGLDGQPLRMHVLLVDDAAVIRRQGKLFLEQLGCTCVTLEDGDQVQAALETTARPFDAIVLDIVMHRSDGALVCKELRQRSGLRAPIIAMTGNTRSSDLQRYYAMGFDVVLPKPFTRESLGRVLVEGRERCVTYNVSVARYTAQTTSTAPPPKRSACAITRVCSRGGNTRFARMPAHFADDSSHGTESTLHDTAASVAASRDSETVAPRRGAFFGADDVGAHSAAAGAPVASAPPLFIKRTPRAAAAAPSSAVFVTDPHAASSHA